MTTNDKQPTCDWCDQPATHITHHEKRNTGTLVAYWCDHHYESNQSKGK